MAARLRGRAVVTLRALIGLAGLAVGKDGSHLHLASPSTPSSFSFAASDVMRCLSRRPEKGIPPQV